MTEDNLYYRPDPEDNSKLYIERYAEAENFISEITKMTLWERMIRLPELCIKFLGKQADKYKRF